MRIIDFLLFSLNRCNKEEVNQELKPVEILRIAVETANQNVPRVVTDKFRLDYSSYSPDLYFHSKYTIMSNEKFQDKRKLILLMKDGVKNYVINRKDMKVLRDNRIGIIYNYYDLFDNEVEKIIIRPKEY